MCVWRVCAYVCATCMSLGVCACNVCVCMCVRACVYGCVCACVCVLLYVQQAEAEYSTLAPPTQPQVDYFYSLTTTIADNIPFTPLAYYVYSLLYVTTANIFTYY
jgi:hypothetical protein